jgi:hypothetical protein
MPIPVNSRRLTAITACRRPQQKQPRHELRIFAIEARGRLSARRRAIEEQARAIATRAPPAIDPRMRRRDWERRPSSNRCARS